MEDFASKVADLYKRYVVVKDSSPINSPPIHDNSLAVYVEKTGWVTFREYVAPPAVGRELHKMILDYFCELMSNETYKTVYEKLAKLLHPDELVAGSHLYIFDKILLEVGIDRPINCLESIREHADLVCKIDFNAWVTEFERRHGELNKHNWEKLRPFLREQIYTEVGKPTKVKNRNIYAIADYQKSQAIHLLKTYVHSKAFPGLNFDSVKDDNSIKNEIIPILSHIVSEIEGKIESNILFPQFEPYDNLQFNIIKLERISRNTTDLVYKAQLDSLIFLLKQIARLNGDLVTSTTTSVFRYGTSILYSQPMTPYDEYFNKHNFRFGFVKRVAFLMASYIHSQENQYFSIFRTGSDKSTIIQGALNTIFGIDCTAESEDEARARVKEEIEILDNNGLLTGSGEKAKHLIKNLKLTVGQPDQVDDTQQLGDAVPKPTNCITS